MQVSNSSVARPWKLEQKHFRAGFEADQLVEIAAKKASQMKQCKSWIRKNTSAKLRGSFEVPRESQACANWIKTMWFFLVLKTKEKDPKGVPSLSLFWSNFHGLEIFETCLETCLEACPEAFFVLISRVLQLEFEPSSTRPRLACRLWILSSTCKGNMLWYSPDQDKWSKGQFGFVFWHLKLIWIWTRRFEALIANSVLVCALMRFYIGTAQLKTGFNLLMF
jgi:hypothetical protein